ncbi:MAG TPA: hypothetical protein DCX89_02580 [Saprospirales bacterium]|nr:hypothetical protein [Saprospirales bacterium]HAY70755.1 hypothetical protein [Saprospirales bacterium]
MSFETERYQKNRSKYFRNDDTFRDEIYFIIVSNVQFPETEYEPGGIFSLPCISNDLTLVSSTYGKI